MQRRIGALLATTAVALLAASSRSPTTAQPEEPAGAGVNYTVVGFTAEGPIFEQTGPGKGSESSPRSRPS
jgi:hypothetical protein